MLYRNVCIESTGYFLPEKVLTSRGIENRLDFLWEKLGFQAGYLEMLTGIRERRVWPVGTNPSWVASEAGAKALEKAKCLPSEVEAVIHCGVCRDSLEPSTANVVHKLLDLPPHCQAFDISNACLGFMNGLTVAANMIELGQIKTALVVTGENSGPIYEDTIKALSENPNLELLRNSVASLTLGSGAVAFVLQSSKISSKQHYLLGGLSQTDHDSYDLCQGNGDIYHQSMVTDTAKLMKKGLALSKVTWEYFKEHLSWSAETPKHIFNHQVSKSHQNKVFSLLGLDPEKGYSDMEWLGNTGTSAAPMSLAIREEEGKLQKGDKLAMLGIGSGLNSLMLGVEW